MTGRIITATPEPGSPLAPARPKLSGGTGVSAKFSDVQLQYRRCLQNRLLVCRTLRLHPLRQQQFPERSYVIATASGLDIIDADTQKLWMRFSQGTNYALGVDRPTTTPTRSNALNGKAYISTNGSAATGLYRLDFAADARFPPKRHRLATIRQQSGPKKRHQYLQCPQTPAISWSTSPPTTSPPPSSPMLTHPNHDRERLGVLVSSGPARNRQSALQIQRPNGITSAGHFVNHGANVSL